MKSIESSHISEDFFFFRKIFFWKKTQRRNKNNFENDDENNWLQDKEITANPAMSLSLCLSSRRAHARFVVVVVVVVLSLLLHPRDRQTNRQKKSEKTSSKRIYEETFTHDASQWTMTARDRRITLLRFYLTRSTRGSNAKNCSDLIRRHFFSSQDQFSVQPESIQSSIDLIRKEKK